jgi:Zn-dependent M28 family amino/carboxypeptidase
MADAFRAAGLDVWLHNFTTDIDQQNVVGIQWGTLRDQWVIVGAHYDTFSDDCIVLETAGAPCPGRKATGGVYDDGSGTALTLYMAKVFSNVTSKYTIAYVAFDGEEKGLEGSKAFVDTVQAGESPFGNVTIHAAIDVDMFGLNWPGVNTPVEFLNTNEAMQAAVEAARVGLGVPDDMIVYGDAAASGGSDFGSFTDVAPTGFFSSNMGSQGLPSTPAGATPTAPGVYPFWHLVDTWETMTASAGGPENLAAGFDVGMRLEAALLYAVAVEGVDLA